MVIAKVCALNNHHRDTIQQVFEYHAQTFREQDEEISRLRFREPSYNAFMISPKYTSKNTGKEPKPLKIASIVVSHAHFLFQHL